MILLRKLALAACITAAFYVPASADELTDGAKAQLALSDQLISLGRERKDAILILAGAHLRNNLTNDPIGDVGTVPEKDALLDEAKGFAGGREDLIGLADDIKAADSRGCYNWNGGTGSFSCPIGSQFAR
jgi:hypothetical protein